jgi:hypothetical protein
MSFDITHIFYLGGISMANKSIDLSKQRFGKWTVIGLDNSAPTGDGKSSKWICKCDCGIEKSVFGKSLRNGNSQSCGHEKKDDLVGQKFGTLIVIREDLERKTLNRKWICQCIECGKLISVIGGSLKNGRTINCGCRYLRLYTNYYHEYKIWKEMIRRCENNKCNSYKNYGGRGIKVCDRWQVFKNFYVDMGQKPEGMSIDRKDVNGDYCPENCRWATDFTQANNRRDNVFIEYGDINITIAQWARLLDIIPRVIYDRIGRLNYPIEQALFKDGNTIQIAERVPVKPEF